MLLPPSLGFPGVSIGNLFSRGVKRLRQAVVQMNDKVYFRFIYLGTNASSSLYLSLYSIYPLVSPTPNTILNIKIKIGCLKFLKV